jgi:GTPase SAR1 family protein
MAPMYYRGASAAVLAFDLTSQESYVAVKDWVKELHGNVDSELVVAIAGNKVDMADERQVETKVASEYAKSIGALYVETSAKDNIGTVSHSAVDETCVWTNNC